MVRIKIRSASWIDRSLIQSGAYYPDWYRSEGARLKSYSTGLPLTEMREKASEVHVAMNTNTGDQGIVNARPLRRGPEG